MVAALYASQAAARAIIEPQELDHLPVKDKRPEVHGAISAQRSPLGCGLKREAGKGGMELEDCGGLNRRLHKLS
jgi:hypothetical protein